MNWDTKIPMTDDEVRKYIKENYSPDIGESLLGYYECCRQLGSTVLEAWKETLEMHISHVEKR